METGLEKYLTEAINEIGVCTIDAHQRIIGEGDTYVLNGNEEKAWGCLLKIRSVIHEYLKNRMKNLM